MKKLSYSIFLLFLLSSFSLKSLFKKQEPDIELACEVQEKVGQKLSKRHQIIIIGDAIEIPSHILNLLGLHFQIQGPLSKNELRSILVDCVEEFLCSINSNNQIRPYLKSHPFTPKNISISLNIVRKNGIEVPPPNIYMASSYDNNLIYFIKDSSDPYRYTTEEETYEDALKLLGRTPGCTE